MKLNAKMGTSDMIIAMAEGNPGALSCLIELVKTNYGFLDLLVLDRMEVYGEKIYILWNDCCSRNMTVLKEYLRSFRRGEVSKEKIHETLSTEKM